MEITSPVREGGSFLTGKSLPAADVRNKSLRKLRKGGWELVAPGKVSYLKTNPSQTCLFLLYSKCCQHFPLHPIFLVQFKKYFGKIPLGCLHKGTLGCINPSFPTSFNAKPHWQLDKPNFLSPDFVSSFFLKDFLKPGVC